MSFEVPEGSEPTANRRNAARQPVNKVMFGWTDGSSRFKDALVVTQRFMFLRASAREV